MNYDGIVIDYDGETVAWDVVSAVVDRFLAGEEINATAEDFALSVNTVRAILKMTCNHGRRVGDLCPHCLGVA